MSQTNDSTAAAKPRKRILKAIHYTVKDSLGYIYDPQCKTKPTRGELQIIARRLKLLEAVS